MKKNIAESLGQKEGDCARYQRLTTQIWSRPDNTMKVQSLIVQCLRDDMEDDDETSPFFGLREALLQAGFSWQDGDVIKGKKDAGSADNNQVAPNSRP